MGLFTQQSYTWGKILHKFFITDFWIISEHNWSATLRLLVVHGITVRGVTEETFVFTIPSLALVNALFWHS